MNLLPQGPAEVAVYDLGRGERYRNIPNWSSWATKGFDKGKYVSFPKLQALERYRHFRKPETLNPNRSQALLAAGQSDPIAEKTSSTAPSISNKPSLGDLEERGFRVYGGST